MRSWFKEPWNSIWKSTVLLYFNVSSSITHILFILKVPLPLFVFLILVQMTLKFHLITNAVFQREFYYHTFTFYLKRQPLHYYFSSLYWFVFQRTLKHYLNKHCITVFQREFYYHTNTFYLKMPPPPSFYPSSLHWCRWPWNSINKQWTWVLRYITTL